MISSAAVRRLLVVGMALLAVACTSKEMPGDEETKAATITWTDGRPAIQITCSTPGGCLTRAIAMCGDNYNVLQMKNMPTRGDMTVVRGTGTVVVRCP